MRIESTALLALGILAGGAAGLVFGRILVPRNAMLTPSVHAESSTLIASVLDPARTLESAARTATPVESPPSEAADDRSDRVPLHERSAELPDELEAMLAQVRELMAGVDESNGDEPLAELRWALINLSIEQGRLDVAREIIGDPKESPYATVRLAEALADAGQASEALALYEQVFEGDNLDLDVIEYLAAVDATVALQAFDRQLSAAAVDASPGLVLKRATLLLEAGRIDEAVAQAERADVRAESLTPFIEILRESDPDVALAMSHRLSAAAANGELENFSHADAQLFLADSLFGAGDVDGASAIALEIFQSAQDADTAFARLLEYAPDTALEVLAASGHELEYSQSWVNVGDLLEAGGNAQAAGDAWLRALALQARNEEWLDAELLEKAAELTPTRAFELVDSIASETRDDEVLGDLADFLWAVGRKAEALELWRRANAIDPGDSEWLQHLIDSAQVNPSNG